MPQLEYFVVAESYSIDQFTNRVSIFNVVENIQVPAFPYSVAFVAISAWNERPGEENQDCQAMVIVNGPGFENPYEAPANFKMTNPRHRVCQQMENIEVRGVGEITVEIRLNGEHAATHRITVLPPFPQPNS